MDNSSIKKSGRSYETWNNSPQRYIHLQKEDRLLIAKTFGVTEKTVLNALQFDAKRGNTDTAKRIRKMAMEHRGIIMVQVPEWETLFDADRYMRQYFPNGVLLEFSFEDGGCDVFFRGEKVRRYEHVMVEDMKGIQKYAEALR